MKKAIFILVMLLLTFTCLYSQDGIMTWTFNYTNGMRIWDGTINLVNKNIIYLASPDSGVFKTTNGGLNWFAVNNGIAYNKVQCIAISKSNPNVLYAGTDSMGFANSGVYKTTNGGNNWALFYNGVTDCRGVQDIEVHPSNPDIAWICVFNAIAPSAVGLWKTTNGGLNWFASNTGIGADNKNMLAICINPLNPNVLYAGTSLILPGSTGPSKIYKTYDGGANWFAVVNGLPSLSTSNNPVRSLSICDVDTSRVVAGLFVNDTTGGIYLTTNGGQLWAKKWGIPNVAGTLPRVISFRPGTPYEIFVGLDRSTASNVGIWRSTNGGEIWTDFSGGALTNIMSVRAMVWKVSGDTTTLFAGVSGTAASSTRGVYEYTWPNPPVGLKGNTEIPAEFSLEQNYPNPFNQSTIINFRCAMNEFVQLKIYDLLGREVAVLVNEFLRPGSYQFTFNASDLTSGVYFYRLEAGNFVETRMMVLTK